MNIRIKFSKQGVTKYVGHLDIMRYFQKANRRAGVDIRYSEGYSPHQIMSFAAPLGVGIISKGEYFDIEVNSTLSSKEMIDKMNAAMVDGIEILSYRALPDNAKNCMSIVAGADYNAYFDKAIFDNNNLEYGSLEELVKAFYSQTEINILKKTKKSEKIVDIKPMIYDMQVIDNDENSAKYAAIFMKVAQGSVANLKPELVFMALCNFAGINMPENEIVYERLEMYANTGNENEIKLVSLESFGEEIK